MAYTEINSEGRLVQISSATWMPKIIVPPLLGRNARSTGRAFSILLNPVDPVEE